MPPLHHPPPPLDRDAAIRATNDDALASKLCALRKAYFADPFLEPLAAHLSPPPAAAAAAVPSRPPLINRGTAFRELSKRAVVAAFLRAHAPGAQLVSLGAGYDTLALRLAAARARVHVVELDLARVVGAKTAAVCATAGHMFASMEVGEGGVGLVARSKGEGKESAEEDMTYVLRACDLREAGAVIAALQAAGVRRDAPTLVLAEIVLVYLEPACADAVVAEVGRFFTGVRAFVNIEHVEPDDAFGREMVRNIAARGSPLKGIGKYPTVEAQCARFEKGWGGGVGVTMLEASERRWGKDERERLNAIEHLDEVEEWQMLMAHYCIVVGGDKGVRERMVAACCGEEEATRR